MIPDRIYIPAYAADDLTGFSLDDLSDKVYANDISYTLTSLHQKEVEELKALLEQSYKALVVLETMCKHANLKLGASKAEKMREDIEKVLLRPPQEVNNKA